MDRNFLYCPHCGNIIAMVEDKGTPISCCGEHMKELVPGTVDAAAEKHVPVITKEGDNKVVVTVGEVAHPMGEDHYIEWIILQTKQGNQRKFLKPGDEPKKCFRICDNDEVVAAYAYCNLHSLWKSN